MSARGPTSIDQHVGARLRLRRSLLEMSQSELGEKLGVTFQQVQKYERGTNRIGASRLFHVAKADGTVTPDEMEFLSRVADIFGFSEAEFRRIRSAHVEPDEDDPYVILGIDADISDLDLKRAYRRIASQNHPDRMIARGAPPEILRIADEKMATINAAYGAILHERGLALHAAS